MFSFARVLRHIIRKNLPPERIAISFAIGLSLAFNPLIGLQLWTALLICKLVKNLHNFVLIAMSCFNNPLTMVPIASFQIIIGNLLLHGNLIPSASLREWQNTDFSQFSFIDTFKIIYQILKPMFPQYFLGGLVTTIIAFPVGYYLTFALLSRFKKPESASS